MQSKESKKPSGRPRKKKPAEGLGDTIENITEATGIKKAVDWFSDKTGVDCGCDKRKEKLNHMFRYRRPVACLNKDEYDFLKTVVGTRQMNFEQRKTVTDIYNRVFDKHLKYSSCSSCNFDRLKQLEAVYKTYEE